MKRLIPILGMIVPTLGLADMTLVDPQGNEIRLLETPCVSKAGVGAWDK